MYLAFYNVNAKGSEGNGHLMDRLIGLWTRGDFSHAELLFSDGKPRTQATCFSSSPRDGGCRFKDIDVTDGKWTLVPLSVCMMDELKVEEWCRTQVGKPYDWPGIFGFVCWPFVRQDPKRFFCSEVVVAALQQIGMFPGVSAWRVSPNRLYKMVRERK